MALKDFVLPDDLVPLNKLVAEEGDWAVLWPGYYGPFTACWIHGRWQMCEAVDLDSARRGMILPFARSPAE